MSLPSDYELLQRYGAGDAKAMDLLVDRHAGRVYGYVRRFVGADALAEDLTQEVWLRVLRSGSSFSGRSRFSTWLFSVARSVVFDHARATRRRSERLPATSGDVAGIEGDERLPFEQLSAAETRKVVDAALDQLPPEQREVFLLREEGLALAEIAELQEVPRDTAKSRLRYALTQLRRILRVRLGEESTRGL